MKKLELLNGRGIAVLDDEDYKFAIQWNWCATTKRVNGDIEVYRGKKKPKKHNLFLKRVLLAREIEQYAKQHNVDASKVFVDFKNHNTLDLRRENMQIGTRIVSAQNVKRVKRLLRGITYSSRLKGYMVQVSTTGNCIRSIVDTKLEAMNLWNHLVDKNLEFCHTRYNCEFIPLDQIKIRERDMVKQREQIKSIAKAGNRARNKNAKYYAWSMQNKAFVIRIKGQFFGYQKQEEQAIERVASLKAEKPELFN